MENENNKIIVSDGKTFTNTYTLTSQFQKQNRNSYPYFFHKTTYTCSNSSSYETLLILSPSHVTSINLSTSSTTTYTLPQLPFLNEPLIHMTGAFVPHLNNCINVIVLTKTKLHSLYITENNDVLVDSTLFNVSDISTTTNKKQLHNISFTTCHPFSTHNNNNNIHLIVVLSNNYIVTLKHLDKVCKDNEMIINEIITKIRRPFKKEINVCTSKVNYNYKNGVLIESYCYSVNNNNRNGSGSVIECNIANVMMFDNGNDIARIIKLAFYKDKYCCLIYDSGLVYIVDMMMLPWKIIRSYKCIHGRVVNINFTSDGVLCLISTEDNDVYVVNIHSGDVECILQGHMNYISQCNSILLSSRNCIKATNGVNDDDDLSKYFSYTNTTFEEINKYHFVYQLWIEDNTNTSRSVNIRDSVKALIHMDETDPIKENDYIIITAGMDGVVNSYTFSINQICDISVTQSVVVCKGEVDMDYIPVVSLQEAKFIGSRAVFQHEKVHCVVSNEINRKPIYGCYMSSDLRKMFVIEKENNINSSFNIRIYVSKYKNIN